MYSMLRLVCLEVTPISIKSVLFTILADQFQLLFSHSVIFRSFVVNNVGINKCRKLQEARNPQKLVLLHI